MKKINRIFKCNRIRRFGGKISSFLKKKIVRCSLRTALILTILCYFADNQPLFTGESLTRLYITQRICDFFHIEQEVDYGEVLFCDTSYDLDLVPVLEYNHLEYSDTLGVSAITDRNKLYRFLDLLQKGDKYRYLIIDLAFDENDKTKYDDALYDKILSMRNIVIANDNGFQLATKLKDKGIDGLDSYYITKTSTNFSRFEYSENDKRSIPLFVFEKLYPEKSIHRFGIGRLSVYFSNGHLCHNSNFLTFDDFYSGERVVTLSENNDLTLLVPIYQTINSFISKSEDNEEELVSELASASDGKVVIIGNYVNDIHDTYMGKKPGPVIIARALQTLIEGKHIVSLWHTLIWFVIFFLISFLIYKDEPISMYIPILKRIPYKFIHMIISLISYGFVIGLCSIIEYALFNRVYSLIVPLIGFAVIKLIVQYSKFDKL